jgi:hypothetical protein
MDVKVFRSPEDLLLRPLARSLEIQDASGYLGSTQGGEFGFMWGPCGGGF